MKIKRDFLSGPKRSVSALLAAAIVFLSFSAVRVISVNAASSNSNDDVAKHEDRIEEIKREQERIRNEIANLSDSIADLAARFQIASTTL